MNESIISFVMRVVSLRWFCLFVSIPVTSSFVVESRDGNFGGNSLGTAAARDETDNTLLMTGVTSTSMSGISEMFGLVMVLDSQKGTVEEVLMETPTICTCSLVVNHGINGLAIIAGISGDKSIFQPLENLSAGLPYHLPDNTIPVAMTNGEESYVFVAVQDTDGNVYTQTTTDGDTAGDNMKRLTNYLNQLTQPATASASPPQILKVDAFLTTNVAFHITLDVQDGKATIAGLLVSEQYLIVAGSTNGSGSAVGNKISGHNDWDGYIGFLNALTGKVEHEAIRIDTELNDFVNDICLDDAYVYIVGTTEGNIEGGTGGGGAFVFKMEIATGNVEWSRQFSGTNVEGLGCAVSQELWCVEGLGCTSQHVVFIGGSTNAILGRNLDGHHPIADSKTRDVFVTALSPFDGQTIWTKQLDSTNYFGNEREDYFVSMSSNSDGDVSIYFNSMTADDDGGNDIVLVKMNKSTGENEFDGLGDDSVAPSNTQTNDDNNKAIIIPAIVVPIFLALLVIGWHFSQHRVEHVKRPLDNDHDLSFQPSEQSSDAKVFV
jgi:hypothetical protein